MLMFKAGNDCWRGFRSRLPKSLEDSRCGSVRKDWSFYSFKTLKGQAVVVVAACLFISVLERQRQVKISS